MVDSARPCKLNANYPATVIPERTRQPGRAARMSRQPCPSFCRNGDAWGRATRRPILRGRRRTRGVLQADQGNAIIPAMSTLPSAQNRPLRRRPWSAAAADRRPVRDRVRRPLAASWPRGSPASRRRWNCPTSSRPATTRRTARAGSRSAVPGSRRAWRYSAGCAKSRRAGAVRRPRARAGGGGRPGARCLQVPAFLCRQTDLLLACGRTGRCVNIKKGQFLAPEKMQLAVEKVRETGNAERAGHRSRHVLRLRAARQRHDRLAGHAAVRPGRLRRHALGPVPRRRRPTSPAGGASSFPLLARAAVAAGIDALFMEVHDDPPRAKSDAATVWPLAELPTLLATLSRLRQAVEE